MEDIRRSRLTTIERKGDRVWDEIETAIARRSASGYDEAARLLVDLKAIATKNQTSDAFRRRVDSMRARHASRRKFIERLEGLS
ncbi:MAG: hypothetical protein ACR2OU_09935 [Thermomicrobiales bacterium]